MATGLSLHIGINVVDPAAYGGWSGPLRACEADAHDMAAICTAQGFSASKLITAEATRAAVTGAIRDAASKLVAGDTFVVSYAGHGGHLPDENGDEVDFEDETWCLYDGQLIDDEIGDLWCDFKPGVRIAVFSDSCHSGTVIRQILFAEAAAGDTAAADAPRYRFMPPEAVLPAYRAMQAEYDRRLKADYRSPDAIAASVVLLSGCQDAQVSQDGSFNGLFTGTLKRCWNGGAFGGGYEAFADAIRAKMPADQSPNFYTAGPRDAAFESAKAFSI